MSRQLLSNISADRNNVDSICLFRWKWMPFKQSINIMSKQNISCQALMTSQRQSCIYSKLGLFWPGWYFFDCCQNGIMWSRVLPATVYYTSATVTWISKNKLIYLNLTRLLSKLFTLFQKSSKNSEILCNHVKYQTVSEMHQSLCIAF